MRNVLKGAARSIVITTIVDRVIRGAGGIVVSTAVDLTYHVADGTSLGQVVTTQFIAQEVVRSAVSTMGLIAAVPITTGLAAVTLTRFREPPGTMMPMTVSSPHPDA
ncbi:MAG: YibE/F family protein [Propioniciclava sp.]